VKGAQTHEAVGLRGQELEDARTAAARLDVLRDLPAETTDGVRVQITGNIEFPSEAEHCLARGCDGIGLYRTEFLYLTSRREPTEDDHFAAYRAVVLLADWRPGSAAIVT
jgi:phosphotransferase system enzyme I (PtsI)